jgi:2Fe-2S ferredoxin
MRLWRCNALWEASGTWHVAKSHPRWYPARGVGKLTGPEPWPREGPNMPVLKVVDRDGVEHEVKAASGGVLMEPLRDMDDGVTAICGGMCSCATCHVYVDAAWTDKLPKAMSDEMDMLKDLSAYKANSRLSCQIQLTEALTGLKVTIAPEE